MRLPDSSDINPVVAAPANTPTSVASAAPIGQGIADVGGALARLGDRRAKFDVARAKSDFLRRKVELDGSFDQDREWDTMPQRYEEGAKKSLGESAKMIRNERARALFMEEAQVDLARGLEAANDFAFSVERDEARASLNTGLQELHQSAISSDYNQAYETAGALLEGSVEAGFYSAEEAGNVERSWKGKYAADKIALMPANERAEALDQPWANNIPTATRVKILQDAETDARKDEAYSIVTGMLNEGMSLAESNKEIRQIEDRELRNEVKAARDYEFAQENKALAEEQDKFYEDYGMQVRMGDIPFSQIPRDALEFMTVAQVDALQRASSNKLAGKQLVTDRKAYAKFYDIYSTGKYEEAKSFIYENSDKFDDGDFQSLIAKSSKQDEKMKDIESSRSLDQRISQTLRDAGINADVEDKGELWRAYDRQFFEYQELNDGRKPDDEWTQSTLDKLAIEQRIKVRDLNPFNDVTKQRYQITELGDIPQEHIQSVLSALPEAIETGDAEEYYNDALLVFSREGIENPTSDEISAMITARRAAAGR